MENLILSLDVVLPVFFLMLIGQILRRVGLFSASFSKQLNTLGFQLFLPCMLFYTVYQFDIRANFKADLIFFAMGSLLVMFAALWIFVPKLVHNPRQQAVVMQGVYRSNYVIFGVAMITNMYGAEQAGLAGLLCAVLVPTYNFLSVIALEVFTTGEGINFKRAFASMLKNPLIWGSLLGIFCSYYSISLPTAVDSTVSSLATLATPLALLVLGSEFDFESLKGNLKVASITVGCKLVVAPLIFVPIAILLGYREAELLALALAYQTPVAVASYIMAIKADADSELAGQIIVLSSAACIVTVFLMIFTLKQLQFL